MDELPQLAQRFRDGQAVIFLGADLSAQLTGLPSRADIARGLARHYQLPESTSLTKVAQLITHRGRVPFTDYLIHHLDTHTRQPQHIHQVIAQIAPRTIITTAYDDLLERAFAQMRIPVSRVILDVDLPFVRTDRPTIIKLYGDLQQRDSLVVTEDDLDHLWMAPNRAGVLRRLLDTLVGASVLLIGYDFSDTGFRRLWHSIWRSMGEYTIHPHAVIQDSDIHERDGWKPRQVTIINEHPLLYLEKLAAAIGPRRQHQPDVPAARSDPMASDEDIDNMIQRLAAHRTTLATLLRQEALIGTLHTPPAISNGIREARAGIQHCKSVLNSWEVSVADQPDDSDLMSRDVVSSAAMPAPPAAVADVRRTSLQLRLTALVEEHAAVTQQLTAALGPIDRVRLQRQLDNLEQEMASISQQMQN